MSKLKERLFGLIVVIALGVIFVPMLLENTQNPKSNATQEVPVAVAKNENDKNQKPDILAKLKESSSEKPVVYDDKQPINDRPDITTKDDKAQKQKKHDAQVKEQQAESLKAAEEEKAALQQREQAKMEQFKLEEAK
ncbi:MAG TPA: hypothetical protein PLD88_01645, partial [Candidatus Berkiella sp.]|nr:hypothetical protein [Candidatus Berkiella sp.]